MIQNAWFCSMLLNCWIPMQLCTEARIEAAIFHAIPIWSLLSMFCWCLFVEYQNGVPALFHLSAIPNRTRTEFLLRGAVAPTKCSLEFFVPLISDHLAVSPRIWPKTSIIDVWTFPICDVHLFGARLRNLLMATSLLLFLHVQEPTGTYKNKAAGAFTVCGVQPLEQLQVLKLQTMRNILQSPPTSCPELRLNPFGLAGELDSKAQSSQSFASSQF